MAARHGTTVVLLGTGGGPVPVAGRAMTAQAILVGDAAYLVDCGTGTTGRLIEAGLRPADLRALLLTHLHADHVADYFATVAAVKPFAVGEGRSEPLAVVGPVGTRDLHDRVLAAFAVAVETQYRASRLGPGLRDLVGVREIEPPAVGAAPAGPLAPEMEPFGVYDDDRVSVTAVLVAHAPIFPAFAFRFDTDDGAVVLSGDTIASGNVVRLARGADVLVHEAMHAAAMIEHGTAEPFVRMLARSHTDVTEVGAVAAAAGVGHLVLSHLIPLVPGSAHPPGIDDEQWIAPIRRDFHGPVTLGADLLRIVL